MLESILVGHYESHGQRRLRVDPSTSTGSHTPSLGLGPTLHILHILHTIESSIHSRDSQQILKFPLKFEGIFFVEQFSFSRPRNALDSPSPTHDLQNLCHNPPIKPRHFPIPSANRPHPRRRHRKRSHTRNSPSGNHTPPADAVGSTKSPTSTTEYKNHIPTSRCRIRLFPQVWRCIAPSNNRCPPQFCGLRTFRGSKFAKP